VLAIFGERLTASGEGAATERRIMREEGVAERMDKCVEEIDAVAREGPGYLTGERACPRMVVFAIARAVPHRPGGRGDRVC
jgi:hypothetical protein